MQQATEKTPEQPIKVNQTDEPEAVGRKLLEATRTIPDFSLPPSVYEIGNNNAQEANNKSSKPVQESR